jgi:hypothetical protein
MGFMEEQAIRPIAAGTRKRALKISVNFIVLYSMGAFPNPTGFGNVLIMQKKVCPVNNFTRP